MAQPSDRSTPLDTLCEQAPPYVRAIAPYLPGKPITAVARELGLDVSAIVKLASNENPAGMSPRAKAAIESELAGASRYPDGFALAQAISRTVGVEPAQVVLGNGSNDLLEMVASAFLAPGREAVFSQYAFAVYPLATQARGARAVVVPARDFGHDLEAMRAAVTAETRVIFVANPNNPTGTRLPAPAVEAFLAAVPADVVVVLDEAYNEYLPPAERTGSVPWLAAHPNLVITRTFSKAYGLAGLRVGYALAHPRIADLLNRVRQPFNVNTLALAAAEAALGDTAFVDASYDLNCRGMQQLLDGFARLGLAHIPSHGNFVCVQIPRQGGEPAAATIFQALLRQGVIVRPLANYGMPDHLRVTVGLPHENARFLDVLGQSLDC
jgi:histidinol-phosphate aminotransferase